MEEKSYYSNAKLLLTGEYLVLQGARALALPLKLGQRLVLASGPSDTNRLTWEAYQPEGLWFEAVLAKNTFEIQSTNDNSKAERLAAILTALRQLNASVFAGNDLHCTTRLGFNPAWGLGSSSTLIANLARWAMIDPYQLLKMTFGGSGYDIACATANGPILYQNVSGHPTSHEIRFSPSFSDKLHFVYQGKKQNSAKEIGRFKALANGTLDKETATISAITEALTQPIGFDTFCQLLKEHESILSGCLSRAPLQTRFPSFDGVVKSLGAWGGDFFLAASTLPKDEVRRYFSSQGFATVIAYNDLVL